MDITIMESELEQHYKRKRRLRYLNQKLPEVQRQINVYEEKIKTCDYSLEDTLSGIDYSGIRVQSSKISKPTEEELMRVHEAIERKLDELRADKKDTEDEISILDGEINLMGNVLSEIPEEHAVDILEQIYGHNKPLREIGVRIGYSHSAVGKIKDRCLEWLYPVLQPVSKPYTN